MNQLFSKVATACAFESAKSSCWPKAALLFLVSLRLSLDGTTDACSVGGGGVLVLESVDFLLILWNCCIGMPLPGSLLLLF